MKQIDNHCRDSYLMYTTREMHATRITRLEKNLQNIKSSFHNRMQALKRKVKSQDQMVNEMKDESNVVMEHLKAKEDIYATIKGELDVSKQQFSDIEKEREKTLADLYHLSSNHQMKIGDILATLDTSGLIGSAKTLSAWERLKLFFCSKLRRREARKQALSRHIEYACCYLSEVTTALEKLFPKCSDVTECYLYVESNKKKIDVIKDNLTCIHSLMARC